MNRANQPEKLPYVVKEPLWVKIIGLSWIVLYFWISPPDIDSFNNSDLSDILGFLFMILLINYAVMRVFFTKTVLDEELMINTNFLLIEKQFSYQDIKNMKRVGNGNVKLILNNGSRVKIHCGNDNYSRVISIIKAKTS